MSTADDHAPAAAETLPTADDKLDHVVDRRARRRLRERREELGLTLADLAERTGSHVSFLSRLERFEVKARPWLQARVAETVELDVDELFAHRLGRPKGRTSAETAQRRQVVAAMYGAG